ncbi:MAG: EI24 domain-containing protein [Deltaproteobacteria bacterium]|nr:EI24 domain-containing protein [Deltaproteobacteria bacterium]
MSTLQQLRIGLRIHGAGWRFLRRHRTLWPWAVAPFCVQCLCLVAALTIFITHRSEFTAAVQSWLPQLATGPGPTTWGYLVQYLYAIAHWILFLLTSGITLFLLILAAYLVGSLCAAPLNEILAEKTEHLATGRPEAPLVWRAVLPNAWRSIRVECGKALLLLGVPLLILPLHFIPLIGTILGTTLSALWTTWATGFAFVDYPQSYRYLPFRTRLKFARRHALSLLGLGIVFWLPGYLLLGTPALVVSGTLLYGTLGSAATTEEK